MSPAKADATRRRLLDAATADFAAHGIAGARVDRISAAAGINKAQLYAYFGDKLALFGAVFRAHADAMVDAVPFTAEDLPGYAVGLYDASVRRPELVRLAMWARLEGVSADDRVTDASASAAKLRAIGEAQRGGFVTASIAPQDVLGLVISMALTWSSVGLSGAATEDAPPAEHERRREALASVVSRAFLV
ncbi:TetR family transcriptional regulator [Streptomyces sp. NPDC088124]|uniref:TetR/AcrR family transcriptional regulator n=1 Tax=Streptomyces sp. NPDC088124 TaxID=3154654 RepID=UPI003434B447